MKQPADTGINFRVSTVDIGSIDKVKSKSATQPVSPSAGDFTALRQLRGRDWPGNMETDGAMKVVSIDTFVMSTKTSIESKAES